MQLNAKNQESMGKERSTMGKFETLGTNMDERTGRNNGTNLNRFGYLKYRLVIYFQSEIHVQNSMIHGPDYGLIINVQK